MIVSKSKNERTSGGVYYPCLKISKNSTIVMFLSDHEGIVVCPGTDPEPKIGHLSLNWSDVGWTKYTGIVTLKNKS